MFPPPLPLHQSLVDPHIKDYQDEVNNSYIQCGGINANIISIEATQIGRSRFDYT